MLRANVGLSRKLSKDYNSTGFTVNLDGEITASISDAEAVMEQVRELFDMAEEALDQQIERTQGVDAIASRDGNRSAGPDGEQQRQRPENANRHGPANGRPYADRDQRPHNGNGNGQRDQGEPASNKQINYLLNIGKRQRMSTAQLERKLAEILGREVAVYDLTKQAAAVAIDALTNGAGNGRTADNGRH